jgi:hypothetical protein
MTHVEYLEAQMTDAININLRSIAQRERKNGNDELAAILDGLRHCDQSAARRDRSAEG